MFIYSVVISAIILSMLGLSYSAGSGFSKGSANQEVLGQILAANLKTTSSCIANLNLASDSSLAFDPTAAATETGQDVKVKIPQWSGLSANAGDILEAGKTIESLDLQIEDLNISNARVISSIGNIKTYHGVLSVQTKRNALLGSSYAKKPASYISISVDTANGNKVTSCSEDSSDAAICSRFGGVYNSTGNPKCSMPAPNVQCPAGEVLTGIDPNQNPICQSFLQQCGPGKYMTGYEAGGAIKCENIPAVPGPGNPGTGTTLPTLPNTTPETSTGVWAEVNHSVNDVTCPRFLQPNQVDSYPEGIKDRACYAIGFQCREIICGYSGGHILARATGAQPCLGTSQGETPIVDRKLECVPGAPSVGTPRTVPNGNLKLSASAVDAASTDLSPATCSPDFVCSQLGEKCKILNVDMMTGAPNGTARIHECQENNEIYGHIQYSHTMNVSLPTSCDPTDLPLTHPLFFEWIASVGMTNPSYTWCEFFAMRDLTGLKDHCGPLEEGLVCNNKGSPVCFERLSSTQLKVYSCQ